MSLPRDRFPAIASCVVCSVSVRHAFPFVRAFGHSTSPYATTRTGTRSRPDGLTRTGPDPVTGVCQLTYIHIGHGGVPQRTPLLPAATGPHRHQRHSELARPPRLPLAASPGQAAPTLQPRGLRVERVGWSLLGPRSSRAISLQLVAQGVGLTRPTPAHSDILHPRALCSTSSTLQGVLAPPPQTNLPIEGPRRPLTGWLARPPA